MCEFVRVTRRRGRSAVPLTLPRTRRWRLARAAAFAFDVSMLRPAPSFSRPRRAARSLSLLGGLTDLAADMLARVADALALVGLRRADLADLGRHLADALLVAAL